MAAAEGHAGPAQGAGGAPGPTRPLKPLNRSACASSSPSSPSSSRGRRSPSSGKGLPGRRSSLAEAMAKAQLRREMNIQVSQDLRGGAELNALFRNPENRRNADKLAIFWSELKSRLSRRHGTLHVAFRALDTSGDGSMNFLEFGEMLRQVHIPLDQRVCRAIFDKAAGGDRALSLEELQATMMEKTIQKLRSLMDSFNAKQERVQLHIHFFLKRLAQADETNRTRGVDRFQRKLTVAFCREFWQLLLSTLGKSRAQSSAVDRSTFVKIVWGLVADHRFQAYEVSFMLRIFERVDSHRHRSVGPTALITTLLLLSSEPGHKDKFTLLFEIFDTDYDGCLQFDQILAMFRCICTQRPIADIACRWTNDQAFQEELSAQEGLRAYERAHWYLQRHSKVEGGVVSLAELLVALDVLPEIMEDLMPGTVRLHWLLDARPRSAFAFGLPGDGKQFLPWATPQRSSADAGMEGSRSGRRTVFQRSKSDTARGSKSRILPSALVAPGSAGRLSRLATPDVKEASEAVKFKKTVTWNFKRSLRHLGDLRLSELTSEEAVRGEDAAEEELGRGGEACRARGGAGGRPGSTALARVQSAPNAAWHQEGLGRHRSSADLPRIDLPAVSPDKWGSEAAERFRLFSTVKSSFGRCDALNPITMGSGAVYHCQLCNREHLLTPLE